jgi:hypothetical protein
MKTPARNGLLQTHKLITAAAQRSPPIASRQVRATSANVRSILNGSFTMNAQHFVVRNAETGGGPWRRSLRARAATVATAIQ